MRQFYKILAVLFLITACTDEEVAELTRIKSSFDSPFPKRTKNLTWTLGNEFSLKHENDTLDFKVSFDKEHGENFIINEKTKDTVFSGTVCKYRGLYYFNRQLNDTTFWIYAVKIENGTIRGLQSEWIQMMAWDSKFENLLTNQDKAKTKKSPILKYVDSKKDIIRLTPDKKEMKKFYESIIDSLPADTLIGWIEPIPDTEIEQEIATADLEETENDNLEIIKKLYPNPAKDNVTLNLSNTGTFQYGIFDINGRLINSGQLTNKTNNIDISEYNSGTYFVRVYPADREEIETIKLIIEN